MTKGVNRRWNMPKGPALEKIRKRKRPKTTVGIPRKALKEPLMKRLPGKFFKPSTNAMGKLHSVAIAIAKPETYNDRNMIE